MKVIIEDGCIACGACESFCADVFKIDDVCVVDESKIAGNEDSIKDHGLYLNLNTMKVNPIMV